MLEHACSDLTLPQYRLLAMVAEGDERASALAGRLALAKPTITAVVDGLVDRGLVRREVVRSDRRAATISITAAGKRALAATEHEMNDRLDALLDRCDDRASVVTALEQLRQALDAAMAERLAGAGAGAGAGAAGA
jgi:DNA-binding MarR family transcriptional regulator